MLLRTLVYFIVVILLGANCSSSAPLAPALYVFGDSLFDGGNNNWLPTVAKANYPPYGQNFPRDRPTGRFSNGKLVADFIAEYLGLPYPPPYVNPVRLFQRSKLTGYNYASGACGILRKTGSDTGLCLPLDEQMKLFKRTISKHLSPKLRHPNQLSQHLAKSIFVFSTGNNDYLGNYFGDSSSTRERYTPEQFTQMLIDEFSLNLQKLYELGARKVVVFELGPLGCLRSKVKQFRPNGRCAENVNQIVINYNTKLSLMLNNLTRTLDNSNFIIGSAYSFAYDAIMNPGNYGFSDSWNPCCKTWQNGTSTCIPFLPVCSNPNKHFFWDGSHPTEAVNSLVASRCFYGSSCAPLNIRQLVQV